MRRTLQAGLVAISLLGGVFSAASPAQARKVRRAAESSSIDYRIAIPDPASRYVDVSVHVPTKAKTTQMAMPAWSPGSYLIRDFGKHVYEVVAKGADGKSLSVTRLDKQTWEVANRGQSFTLSYRVYANDLSVRTSYVDDRAALLNGPALFMYQVGGQARPTTLRVDQIPAGWGVHTAMERRGGSGPYLAKSYDVLADSPLLLGEAEVRRFEVRGTKFEYVYVAPMGTNADVDRLASDAKKVVAAFGDIMGGFPFPTYKFLAIADPNNGGGLEHLRSTAFILRPYAFSSDAAYTSAASLAAHEFFHAWNVKRIHDEVLGPFDYTQETYTDLLWFHEGMTSMMQNRALLAAGILTPDKYLESIAKSFSAYANRAGSDYEPIAQLSRDAWIKGYQPEANHREVTVSYYLKGHLIGVLLDLELRQRSAKNKTTTPGSVEGLFRRLWADAKADARTGEQMRPLTAKDIVAAAGEEAGEPMDAFFDDYVFGIKALPLPQSLRAFGLVANDMPPGFNPDEPDAPARSWSGLRGDGATITSVHPGSPAARAGLTHGDEVLYLDDLRIQSVEQLNARLAERPAGTRARVGFARRGRVDRRVLTLVTDPRRDWSFKPGCITRLEAGKAQRVRAWLKIDDTPEAAKAGCEDEPQ